PISPKAGLADPKEKIGEFNTLLEASDALRAGEYARGERLLNDLAQRAPQVAAVPFMLGEAALRQENWSVGVAHLQRALAINPAFDEAMTGLARALYAQGKAEEAAHWLEKAVSVNDQNYRAWYELARVVSKSDPARTLLAYQKALSIQPNFAPAQRDLGVFELRRKQFMEALRHLQKAEELGMTDAPLKNFIGIC